MLYIKALHIIFVVTWFAGLFYIVRLFVYHVEAEQKPADEKTILQNQFKIMERRLWYGITWPSMLGTVIFGGWMTYLQYGYFFSQTWFWLKMAFVLGLLLYHFQCGRIYTQLKKGTINYSSLQLRIWNEAATLFLVSIVFIVVLKDTLSMIWGIAGLVVIAGILFRAIQLYREIGK